MINYMDLFIAFIIAALASFLLTFLVKNFAVKVRVVDLPNQRKIHTEPKDRKSVV